MSINFPSSPIVGQQHGTGATTWQWDGIGWNIVPQMGPMYISDTPPANPAIGRQWLRSSNGAQYVWDSKQWIQVAGGAPTAKDSIYSTAADMWAGFRSGTNKTFTINDKVDGTGTDVVTMYDNGGMSITGALTVNGQLAVGSDAYCWNMMSVKRINSSANVHLWFRGPANDDQGVIYIDTSYNYNFRTQAQKLTQFLNDGTIRAAYGYGCRAGGTGSYGGNIFNLFYNGSGATQLWIDSTNFGNLSVSSDYRIKKDVENLPGTWETVKALRPVSYTLRDFGFGNTAEGEPLLIEGNDITQWGFIAHELQDALVMSAATGVKDAPDVIQSPNWPPVVAALTKALQEAMARIEALEAR